MKITKTQLKQIIKEELGRVLNEEADNTLWRAIRGVFKRLDPVPEHVQRTMQGKKKVYEMNNGNILIIDDSGVPYISYADERSDNVDIKNLFDTLKGDGYRRAGLAVPMSPKNYERVAFGGPIKAEKIRPNEFRSMRTSSDNEDKHAPLIQKTVGARELSDPRMPNWDPKKDQIVYLGSVSSPSGGEEIYFKTSQSGQYYKISTR